MPREREGYIFGLVPEMRHAGNVHPGKRRVFWVRMAVAVTETVKLQERKSGTGEENWHRATCRKSSF
jgi:hypothetical protein